MKMTFLNTHTKSLVRTAECRSVANPQSATLLRNPPIRNLQSSNPQSSILNAQFFILNFSFFILFFTNISFSQSNPVSFTQEDRDRMIRSETKLDEKFKQAEDRSNQMQKQIDEVKADIKWYFGILIGAMFMLFGFILWDRRTFIKPFQTRVDDVEIELKKEKGKTQSLTEALRELAKTDSKLAEILKMHNLL
jgi:hypothetical protein